MNGETPTQTSGTAGKLFSDAANAVAQWSGRPAAFALASLTVIVWLVTGPLFNYSDTWQLVINTGTTIVTFLMVFLIQNSQNRDSAAIQVKLDELIRSSAARDFYIGVEHLTDKEIEEIRATCEARAGAAKAGDKAADEINNEAAKAADGA
jgi:low affinity Fe/Cu permease